jgi:group I intron endonuclease
MKSGIYKITNIVNNKFYIGSTNNLYRRKREHFRLLKQGKNHCKLLQRAYNKYGELSFTFEVIATCPPEYLFKLEQWFVDYLKPQYNICVIDVSVPIGLSGTAGYEYTEEHKEQKKKRSL